MNTQAETPTANFDVAKQVISVVLLVFGIFAFYHWSDVQLLYRVIGLLVVAAIVVGVVMTTGVGRNLLSFMAESKQEVRKVVWPTRDETVRTTMMVFAMVFVVGFMLWLLDMFLFWGVRFLTGQGV
ncbi:preprotein translocase subunit SecE [Crenothrix polyspora]|jgi:preprotein translocase subunit SecE|uniref:Protein translocase subunit SecE n=1 Tax=Crenothrix polyspora TaxID=360316 RepID=A0A1R4HKL4_9GAMM|nr:preprotein translocase subunit SecE [Crenothrix polyspora]SJM96440.1 Protein translocase subunit SecE [Crenothrix polyspora]